jgi:hypothetical protein
MFKSHPILTLFVVILAVNRPTATYAQSDIRSLTLSVTDTNLSDLENARHIFDWITNHIAYDAKAFSKCKYPNLSPEATLKKRKGLCNEYAGLMTSMCHSIGIEAYAIAGYAKGAEYQEDQAFLRANHKWVVIRIDSTWIHADPTYGSGFLYKKPGIAGTILIKYLGTNYQPYRQKFIHSTDSRYFIMDGSYLAQSHYPLDPAWLQDTLPGSYYAFAVGRDSSGLCLPDYHSAIDEYRFKSQEFREQHEGLKGSQYNVLNKFDLALSIINRSKTFDPHREVTPENIYQFERFAVENSEATRYLMNFKTLLDSIHRHNVKLLRGLNSREEKLNTKVKTKYKSNRKNYAKSIKRTFSKESSIEKKIDREQDKKTRSQANFLPKKVTKDSLVNQNIEKTKLLYQQLINSEYEMREVTDQLDSLIRGVKNQISNQAMMNDSLVFRNKAFLRHCDLLGLLCFIDNEKDLARYFSMQEKSYSDVVVAYARFNIIKKNIAEQNGWVYSQARNIEGLLQSDRDRIRELYFYSPGNDTIMSLYEQNRNTSAEHFDKMIAYNSFLLRHIELQRDFFDDNLYYMQKIKYEMHQQNRAWKRYYRNKAKQGERRYNSEKEIYTELMAEAKNNFKISSSTLSKFRRESD